MTDTEPQVDPLLRAVCADPFDDTLRLAYADSLDERDVPSFECEKCNGSGTFHVFPDPAGVVIVDKKCDWCAGSGWIVRDGSRKRAEHIRWAVANPQNSGVCLCGHLGPTGTVCPSCQMFGTPALARCDRTDGESHYVAHRGFVRELRITQLAFIREAKEIFASEPITRVNLIDVHVGVPCRLHSFPLSMAQDEMTIRSNSHYGDEYVADQILQLVPPHLIRGTTSRLGSFTRRFRSPYHAYLGLSEACVAFGRRLVGLPPLKPVTGVRIPPRHERFDIWPDGER